MASYGECQDSECSRPATVEAVLRNDPELDGLKFWWCDEHARARGVIFVEEPARGELNG